MRLGAQFKTQHSKLNILFSRPFGSSNLAPCLHGGRSGCRYPHEPQQQETKYFIDYD